MQSSVVGNFPKVGDSTEQQKLRRATEDLQKKKISLQDFTRIEDEVTRETIEEQIKAGIALVTDGQIRWQDPFVWPARKLNGVTLTGLIRFFDNNVYYRQPLIDKPVTWIQPLMVDEFVFAKNAAGSRATVKAVLPGPYSLARLSKNAHYGQLGDLVHDLAKALANEIRELEKAGATFIQIDEPSLPFHPEDFKLAAEGLQIALAPVSRAKTALYTYFSSVGKIFRDLMTLPVNILGIDLVSDPENVRLIQQNPVSKDLALGIVDARNTKMEKEDGLRRLLQTFDKNAQRIQYVNPSAGLEFLPRDIAVQKLQLVGKLADRVKETV